ncbi:VC0807 family protein [Fodinicola acaciae]|uniref:VC0807 family protein n=1 Tax=Fodinicola acaciae TaxID=2681555 RepID=UPI0013D6773F|nr:VC0807 family protein [Fodinicola acaciae]
MTATDNRDGVRRLVRANLATVAFDLVLPMVVYYGLRAAGVNQWWALMAGIVVAVPRTVHQLVSRRKLDLMAMFTVSIMVFSLVVGLLTGDARALAVRESWAAALLGLLGLWMVVSVFAGRPALLVLGRTIAVTKVGEAGARRWEERWQHDRRFRRGTRILTSVWGWGLFADAAASIVLTYALPLDLVPLVTAVQFYGVLALLLAFHFFYTKKVDLRA